MLIDIGNKYENLVTNQDYLRVIEDKTSAEFAYEVEKIFNAAEVEKERMINEAISDAEWFERENEQMARDMDDTNSLLQQLQVDIERGSQAQRLDRKKILETLKKAVKMLDSWRDNY